MNIFRSILLVPILLITFLGFSQFISTRSVEAQCAPGNGSLGIPTWYQYLPVDPNPDPITGKCQIASPASDSEGSVVILILMGVFDILLFIAGVVAFVMIIWGGFKLITSTGESQKIADARKTIYNSLIGLAIAIIASQVVSFIAKSLV